MHYYGPWCSAVNMKSEVSVQVVMYTNSDLHEVLLFDLLVCMDHICDLWYR